MSFEQLLEKMALISDISLIASDGTRFQLHRATLASCSGFSLNMIEDLPACAEVPASETAELLTLALSHMYDVCDAQPVTMDNVRSLVALFSKYDVRKRLGVCDTFLSASIVLSTANLPDWLVLAGQHQLIRFLEKCVRFAAERMDAIKHVNMMQLLPSTLTVLVSRAINAHVVISPRRLLVIFVWYPVPCEHATREQAPAVTQEEMCCRSKSSGLIVTNTKMSVDT